MSARGFAASILFAATVAGSVSAQGPPPTPAQTQAPGGRGARGQGAAGDQGGVPPEAYPPRPPVDPAILERGKALYTANCAFGHGADVRGGGGGGPNLLRSQLVLSD